MYPSDVSEMRAYFTCRGPLFEEDQRIIFYGIRYAFDTIISRQITQTDIDEADAWLLQHGVANTPMQWPRELWQRIVDLYNGYIPVEIRALREGSVVYPQIPCFEIIARQGELAQYVEADQFQYLVTWLETALMRIWSPMVTATKSAHVYNLLKEAFELSVEEENHFLLDSRLHDFGSRGVSSQETAMVTGCAHLTSFDGTDTMVAGWLATKYNDGKHIGTSVLATEHSVMTAWETEIEAVRNAISIAPEGSILSVVADTYDYYNFLDNTLPLIASEAKAKNLLFVVRPDSGDPVSCVVDGLVACEKAFGITENNKGYKVLNGAAVIQGDGIDINILANILEAVLKAGYAATNVAFGMGGGLLQKQNRDTLKVAIKLSAVGYRRPASPGKFVTKMEGRMKKPTTDLSKSSLPGPFAVYPADGHLQVYPELKESGDYGIRNQLETIWNCGPVNYTWDTIDTIRQRIRFRFPKSKTVNDSVLSNAMIARRNEVITEIISNQQ
jgi:nicotinamide phosphoribosyltransferase